MPLEKFKVEISLQDPDMRNSDSIADALRGLATRLQNRSQKLPDFGTIFDCNGNSVGSFEVEGEDDSCKACGEDPEDCECVFCDYCCKVKDDCDCQICEHCNLEKDDCECYCKECQFYLKDDKPCKCTA